MVVIQKQTSPSGDHVTNGEDVHQLWKLMRHTGHLMSRARQNELRGAGVTPIQAGVLICIKSFNGPVSLSTICRWILREQNSVSQLLDRMEKQGLIRKTKDEKRKNVVRISITPEGEKIYEASKEVKFFERVLSHFSSKERGNLWKYMDRMRVLLLEELVSKKIPFS